MKNKSFGWIIFITAIIVIGSFYLFKDNIFATTSNTKKIYKIGFVVPTLENPFFVDMTNAAKESKLGDKSSKIEVMVQTAQNVEDALGQNQIVENLITQKVDAICIVPTNSESILPEIGKANEAGIPIINVDNKIDSKLASKKNIKIDSYVGSDNFDGGKLAAQYIVEKLNAKGKIAILEGISGNDAAVKRKDGFMSIIKNNPKIKVVASQVANWNREQAFNLFQNILKANPDLNALFAANDEMALGAYAAAKQANIPDDKLVIVGFDAITEAINAINAGKIDATIAQQPKLMGNKAIEIALDIINHRTVKAENSTTLKIIKK